VKYLLAGLLLLLFYFVLNRRNAPSKAVQASWIGMIGLRGTAEQTFTTDGTVAVNGEIWKATSKKGIVHKGDRVRILAMNPGLVLEVETVLPQA
jgi:membrane-bound ClpP family serine protease